MSHDAMSAFSGLPPNGMGSHAGHYHSQSHHQWGGHSSSGHPSSDGYGGNPDDRHSEDTLSLKYWSYFV